MLADTPFDFSLKNLPKLQSLNAQRLWLILIGAIYPLGFSPFDLWPLTFFSLLLLLNEIVNHCHIANKNPETAKAMHKSPPLSLFSIGFYWAIGAFGVGVSWVYVSIHQFGNAPVLGAIGISFLFVVTLSLIKAGGIYCIGKMNRWLGHGFLLLIIPFTWVIAEFAQTFLFSGFPWLFAGYSQIDGPLWMLATWLGVYGVSWFMLVIAACLVILFRGYFEAKIRSRRRFLSKSYVLLLLVLCAVPLLAWLLPQAKIQASKNSINVALVQPNIAQEKKWDRQYFVQIMDSLYQQSRGHWSTDLLVWPEGAIPAYKHQVKEIINDLNLRAKQSHTDLLLGLPIYQPEEQTSYAAFISLGDYNQSYHKQVLVPFGEYVPLGKTLRGLIEFFDLPMSNFSPANSKQQAMTFKDYQVIPAICYEIAYPDIVQQLISDADTRSDKAKLIVTVSNDAWFGDSFGPYQHMQIARMRALESGIPLVRSTNDGITAVVDARGNLLKRLDRYQQATLSYEVSLTGYQTPYRRFGLLGIYVLLALNLIIFTIKWLQPKVKTTAPPY